MISHYYTLNKIVKESQQLIGSKLLECISQEKDVLVFGFYDSIEFHYLYFSGISHIESIFLSENFSKKRANTINLFQDLYGEIVQNISLLDKTRIIKIDLINYKIYFQLFGGSRNNVIVTKKNDVIIDSFFQQKELYGRKFTFDIPEYNNLTNIDPDISILKFLSYSDFILGKQYVVNLLNENNIDSNKLVSEFSESELNDILKLAQETANSIFPSNKGFILKNEETANDSYFSLIPLLEYPIVVFESNSISECIKKVYVHRIKQKKFKEKYKFLHNLANLELKRAKKQFQQFENNQMKEDLIEKYSHFSELLYSYPNLKEKGLHAVQLNDYNGNPVQIELNPKLKVIENIENYFKKIKNLKKSLSNLSERKDFILSEYENANHLIDELQSINDLKSLKLHYQKNEKFYTSKMNKEDKEITERFKTFIISDNAILYVGKDAKNNDELTFGLGKPNDYWFHLRGGSGSHCILKFTGKGKIPKEIIEKAASIAAYYSSQRNGGYVPVCYTQKKFIRKPKGANPGAVVLSKEEVILVNPKID